MIKAASLSFGMNTLKILHGDITRKGVLMPIYPNVYNPILKDLEAYNIKFKEQIVEYLGYNIKDVKRVFILIFSSFFQHLLIIGNIKSYIFI